MRLAHWIIPCVLVSLRICQFASIRNESGGSGCFLTGTFLHTCLGEGDEDDVRVGVVSGPGGAEPQRCLEAPGHLCLQHGAGPLGGGGGGGTRAQRCMQTERERHGTRLGTSAHVARHLRGGGETRCVASPGGFFWICKYSSCQVFVNTDTTYLQTGTSVQFCV